MKRILLVMKSFYRKKQKGFTLIELIVALGISSILIIVISYIMATSGKIMESNISRNKLNNNGGYAIDYIEKEIRRSINIYNIDDFIAKPKDNNLGFLLEVVPYQAEKNPYQYIYYYLDKGNLIRYSIGIENPIEEGIKSSNIGTNKIAENIVSIKKTYFNINEKFIHLNFQCENNGVKKEYESSIYAGLGM
ncbi:PilW family protein [Miniphocaeibacter halophilus]|uniref:Prepilin-type N-terminal cleavage/methylation domain-containing protein n=1 Tax=Miniphocaeibacter halophilus TaxID=2931922 RepID=A0AC61MTD2_9FIRM|nr:prepilin-type N-terminal cleavage/methylation domain-containing protein [Miniphocaeibacter halophilus]QQK08623.1 prepilin-type N-terminal cleavage/methylation domain-containing protein [Miniphocaeibacter halophilus]